MNKDSSRFEFDSLLTVAPSPHIKHTDNTRTIMLGVLAAMLPAFIWSVTTFGARAATICMTSVFFCVLFEFLYELLLKKPITVLDMSAAVTGMLIGFNLPITIPLWMLPLAAFFAIVIVKQLFGGIGKNVVNPALAARVFLFSWTDHMTAFVVPGTKPRAFDIMLSGEEIDAVASATPLASLKQGVLPETSMFDMFIGHIPGCIGEVSALLLIVGGLILLLRRVITWHIPVAFVGTVYLVSLIFPQGNVDPFEFALYEILSGGLLLGAIFMATDYATSPITSKGRLIYGVGCGLITMFIRYFGGYAEGVSFAILIMNLFVWYIDRLTMPVRFGGVGNVEEK